MRYLQTPAGMTPLAEAMQRYLQTPGGMVSLAGPTLADLDLTLPDDSTIDKFYSNVQSFSRASISTVKDSQGLLNTIGNNEIPWHGAMRVKNLASGNNTQNITVVAGREYHVTIGVCSGSVVCSGAFTGTLTGDSTHRIGFANGGWKLAASTTLTLTVSGVVADIQVEDVTNLPTAQKVPGPYAAFNAVHNSNIAGVKYFPFDRSHITVDANGVVSETGAKVYSPVAYESQGGSTNYLLNSSAPATQSVSLAAGIYTCRLEGAGSVALSGAASGTVTESTKQTFTLASAGSVTVTVTAPVTRFQLEPGRVATPYIPTTSAAASRAIQYMSLKPGLLTDAEGALGVEMEMLYASVDKPTGTGVVPFIRSNNTTFELYTTNTTGVFANNDGHNLADIYVPHASGDVLQFAFSWGNGSKGFSGRTGAGAWTNSTVGTAYDGSFGSDGLGVRIGNGNNYPFRLRKFKTWKKKRDIELVKVDI